MLFYNEDFIHFIMTRFNAGIEVTEENLREYIYSFKDSQVTDFAINVCGTLSAVPSNVFQTYADRSLRKIENGVAVDYSNAPSRGFYDLQVVKGIDQCAVWIKALREININPWLSLRMNDKHGLSVEPGFTWWSRPDFIDEHPELLLVTYKERDGRYDLCLNYAHPEIQDRFFRYLHEIFDKYDVDGLELDFSREMVLFPAGLESSGQKIATEFIGKIRSVLDEYEKIYNHEIKLSLVVPSSPDCILGRGMNIFDFTDKIDYITIISRWATTDTDMPIELWKILLRNTDIILGGGQQLLIDSYITRPQPEGVPTISSVPMAFGQAIANLHRGCDFVYLYNYMDLGEYEGMRTWIYEESIRNDKNRPLIFNNIAKKETLIKQNRSHVITFSDVEYPLRNMHSTLPVRFHEHSVHEKLRVPVGEVPENAKVHLIICVKDVDETTPEDFSVYVNGAKCENPKQIQLNNYICRNDKCYSYEVVKNRYDFFVIELKTNKKCSVEYVEASVDVN